METYLEIIYNPQKEEWGKILRDNTSKSSWQNDAGVSLIVKNVAEGGDQALLSYVRIFDKINLKPTYRLLKGQIGKSYALEISSRYGIKKDIINNI